jgi:hypothetical protein
MIRVSEDIPSLRVHFGQIVRQDSRARIPEHYMRWLKHLLELYSLSESTPDICRHFSFDEIQGLAMMRGVLRETGRNTKTCPRCKRPTSGLFDCEKCGARLT